MKKVLVTGNLGYVGSVLVPELQKYRYEVIGFDIGYFKNCLISKIYKNKKIKQIFKDIRKANLNDFKNKEIYLSENNLESKLININNSTTTKVEIATLSNILKESNINKNNFFLWT